MTEEQHLAVMDVDRPSPEPFAVVAIYPARRAGDGCEGVIVSLHMTREEADQVVLAGGSITGTKQ